MQEIKLVNWEDIKSQIKAKKKFLFWFVPVIFVSTWILTYSVPDYYTCTTSLTAEEEFNNAKRTLMLNQLENFDLGLSSMTYSIVPESYKDVIFSSAFLCRILSTQVTTADNSFKGTYYEYLATHHKYSWFAKCIRGINKERQPDNIESLPALDPFYPHGYAIQAIAIAKDNIEIDIMPRTKLITLKVTEQDPLVVAMITQAITDELNRFASSFYFGKTKQIIEHLQTQITQTRADYENAVRQGDNTHAAMLNDACKSFERQVIILNAQIQDYPFLTTLKNVSVPSKKSGPRHLTLVIPITLLITMLALICICRRELFAMLISPSQE